MFSTIQIFLDYSLTNLKIEDGDGEQLLRAIAHRLSSTDATLVIVSMSSDVAKAGCMMCCYGVCRKCCSSTVDCRPIDVRGLVERVDELEIINRIVLPMYGLAVEVVKARRRR